MKRIIVALLFAVIAISTWSQTAEGIVNKYLENIGGVEKWKALKTTKLIGTAPTPQGDVTLEMQRKAPNKFIISVDVMGQKLIPQAFDGEVAWTINPFMGNPSPQKLPEDQIAMVKSDADFEDPFINFAQKGSAISYEGTADVDGINCSMVKIIKNQGKGEEEIAMVYYFDNETYLPVMVKQTPKSGQMAGQELNVYYSDYQEVSDGLIMPYTIDYKIGGQTVQAVKFTTIELNGEIPDEVFKYKGE